MEFTWRGGCENEDGATFSRLKGTVREKKENGGYNEGWWEGDTSKGGWTRWLIAPPSCDGPTVKPNIRLEHLMGGLIGKS